MSDITIKITMSTDWGNIGTIRIDNQKHYWVFLEDSETVCVPSLARDNQEDEYLDQIKKHIDDNPGLWGMTNDDDVNTIYYNDN